MSHVAADAGLRDPGYSGQVILEAGNTLPWFRMGMICLCFARTDGWRRARYPEMASVRCANITWGIRSVGDTLRWSTTGSSSGTERAWPPIGWGNRRCPSLPRGTDRVIRPGLTNLIFGAGSRVFAGNTLQKNVKSAPSCQTAIFWNRIDEWYRSPASGRITTMSLSLLSGRAATLTAAASAAPQEMPQVMPSSR